jgi:hypothetical protein
MPLNSAGQAFWLMNANRFAAFGTNPFLLLAPHELPDPDFADRCEIVDHAHSVPGSISLVQMFQSGARKTTATFRTILDFPAGEPFAISYFTHSPVF